ncbi:alkaline phosphatase D family protein [Streptomyces griseoviridis]|uniref:Alkaline phosphatase D n=1 Tax=Streptomyces griseoviridis TaxID=45398 RepID=A0ABT9LCQ0_STRGD|nr:alkaline phosphatase D family protein [Streptomyces griseoviridis]MDP9680527.1 alkaline phosphatase D [Streptomyces griseoviridis]GGT08419.1 alkaline phosphatase [Streptomyces griseoviridis]
MSHRPLPGRRSVLRGSLAASAALALSPALGAAPAFARSGRPGAGWGVQTGDVTAHSGLVWVRSDRPARMIVETSATESFRNPRRWRGPLLGSGTDFTGTTRLSGLPAGEQIHYRVLLADPDDPRRTGEPVTGTFRTASDRRRDGVRFVWSGDQAGQGWGINPDIGGYRIYDAMGKLDPDFFLCSGDNIYADGPISATQALPDGRTYRNLTTVEKSKVAETLGEFRGAFRYNLLDDNLRRFNAQVPSIIQWDDHEVRNNWYPGEVITDSAYTVRDVDVLAARARRAFSEYVPISTLRPGAREGRVHRVLRQGPLLDVFVLDMRTYRNANSPDDQTTDPQGILGREQLEWLKRELSRSRAVWKVIAADMPIGLVVPDGTEGKPHYEAIAQGDPGTPLGRELQIAELLRFVKHRRITGTVWLTADVHHTSAQHYQPSRAAFTDFEPFWEFVSGPLNAGAFPASALDGTFGPERVFVKAPTASNVSPADGHQFFGEVDIDGDSAEMTVRLREQDGTVLFTKVLQPGRVGQ